MSLYNKFNPNGQSHKYRFDYVLGTYTENNTKLSSVVDQFKYGKGITNCRDVFDITFTQHINKKLPALTGTNYYSISEVNNFNTNRMTSLISRIYTNIKYIRKI